MDDACPAGHWPGEREKDCPYCFPDDWDCEEGGHVQGPGGICAVCNTIPCEESCGRGEGHLGPCSIDLLPGDEEPVGKQDDPNKSRSS
jgi:hypothetical protein